MKVMGSDKVVVEDMEVEVVGNQRANEHEYLEKFVEMIHQFILSLSFSVHHLVIMCYLLVYTLSGVFILMKYFSGAGI